MREDDEPPPRRKKVFAILTILGVVLLVGAGFFVMMAARGDYTERAQAGEAVAFMGGVRNALAAHFVNENRWPASLEALDVPLQGQYTQSVAITKGANGTGPIELTATMRAEGVRRGVAGRTIVMSSSDGGRTWVCRAGTIDPKYLPSVCR